MFLSKQYHDYVQISLCLLFGNARQVYYQEIQIWIVFFRVVALKYFIFKIQLNLIPVHLDKVAPTRDTYFHFLYFWHYCHCLEYCDIYFSVAPLQILVLYSKAENHLSQEKAFAYGSILFSINILLRKLSALFKPMIFKFIISSSECKTNSN